jgi:transposase
MNRVTLSEAAQILGVHRNTVRNWVVAGKLATAEKRPTSKGLEEWVIDEQEVLELRRSRPRTRTTDQSLGDAAWVIHDLATRLADAEAGAARAEAKLERLDGRRSEFGIPTP